MSTPMPMSHAMHDRMGLEICRELVRFVEGEKGIDNAISKALANLKRWKEAGTGCVIRDEWERLLRAGDWDVIRRTLLDESERGDQMRQMHPFIGILPKEAVERVRSTFYHRARLEQFTRPSRG